MRLATIRNADGSTRAARVDGDAATLLESEDVGALLHQPNWYQLAAADGVHLRSADIELAPVILRPRKVFCVGLNYANHIREMGRDLPSSPTLFTKFDSSLTGANDDIVLPTESTSVDWEAELVVVIGLGGRRIPVEHALTHVAGYSVMNDISMRDWQNRTNQWLAGKAWDSCSPFGPMLVTADELPPGGAGLRITCTVNEEIVQDDNTDDLLFGAASLVADISTFVTLSPGDVIATGTPGGVGAGRTPPRFLSAGDRLRTAIEGIGELNNRIVAG